MRPIHRTIAPVALAAALLAASIVAAPPAAAQPPAPMPPPEPAAPPAAEAEPPAPGPAPFVFEQYQLVLLKRPAERAELPDEQVADIQRRHIAHLEAMAAAGHLLIAGPFSDQEDETLRGMALYQVGGVEEARRLAAADPAVVAGRLEVEVLTWHVGAGYMVFPKRPATAAEEAGGDGEADAEEGAGTAGGEPGAGEPAGGLAAPSRPAPAGR